MKNNQTEVLGKGNSKIVVITEKFTIRNQTRLTKVFTKAIRDYLVDLVTGVGIIERIGLSILLEVDGYLMHIGEEDDEIRFVSTHVDENLLNHDFLEDLDKWEDIKITLNFTGECSVMTLIGADRIHSLLSVELVSDVTYFGSQMNIFESLVLSSPLMYKFQKNDDYLHWGVVKGVQDPNIITDFSEWQSHGGFGFIEFKDSIPESTLDLMKSLTDGANQVGLELDFFENELANGFIDETSISIKLDIEGKLSPNQIFAMLGILRTLFFLGATFGGQGYLSLLFYEKQNNDFDSWMTIDIDQYNEVRLNVYQFEQESLLPYTPFYRPWYSSALPAYRERGYQVMIND